MLQMVALSLACLQLILKRLQQSRSLLLTLGSVRRPSLMWWGDRYMTEVDILSLIMHASGHWGACECVAVEEIKQKCEGIQMVWV